MTLVGSLLDASTLCAIATVTPRGAAYVNTAYFGWTPEFDLFWLSDPDAEHSRNLRANLAAAIAVYDSTQSWGESDRGISSSAPRARSATRSRETPSVRMRRAFRHTHRAS